MLFLPLKVLAMDRSGFLAYMNMVDEASEIQTWWPGRGQYCSLESSCGPFSICNENNRPPCNCLPGFEPIAKKDWDLGEWSGGCIRITNLHCGEEAGLFLLKMVKPSNPTDSTAEIENEEDCITLCIEYFACRCRAYAFTNKNDFPCHMWVRGFEGTHCGGGRGR